MRSASKVILASKSDPGEERAGRDSKRSEETAAVRDPSLVCS